MFGALLRPLAQFENKSVKHYLTEFCIKQKNIKVFSLFTAVNNKSSGTVVDSQIWISQQIASADVWNMKIIAVEKLRTAFPLTNRFVTCCWIKFAIFSEMSEITWVLPCRILPLFIYLLIGPCGQILNQVVGKVPGGFQNVWN